MTATPVLMRPTSVTGLVLSAGAVGTAGSSYYIKLVTGQLRHRTNIADISGDGDSSPNNLANYWLYVDWLIRGYAINSVKAGIEAMVSTSTNPTSNSTMVQLDLASGGALKGRFVIGGVDFAYDRRAEFVGLSLLLRKTCLNDGTESFSEVTSP